MAQPAPDTIAAIRARGQLVCGVSIGAIGVALPDARGIYRGLDVDSCRAVAAAVLGDASKVRLVATTAQDRFASIDFYDGQGFMVKQSPASPPPGNRMARPSA